MLRRLYNLLYCSTLFLVLGKGSAYRKVLQAAQTDSFIIETAQDVFKLARLHATETKQLMFTTFSFSHRGEFAEWKIDQVKHIASSLDKIGRLENSIIISYDNRTCDVLLSQGIPCFVDRYMRQPETLPDPYKESTPHWYQKIAWGAKFIELGYRPLFFETDMVFLKDPLPHANPKYDLMGLSDWRRPEVPSPKGRLMDPCHVYHMQFISPEKGNQMDFGGSDESVPGRSYIVNPCMSLGLWFLEPTAEMLGFLRDFMDLMLDWRPWQVDQPLWNEFLLANSYGVGDRKPLQYSLLDVKHFANYEVYNGRRQQNLEVDPVLLHTAPAQGRDKDVLLKDQGHYYTQHWNVTGTHQRLGHLRLHFRASNN